MVPSPVRNEPHPTVNIAPPLDQEVVKRTEGLETSVTIAVAALAIVDVASAIIGSPVLVGVAAGIAVGVIIAGAIGGGSVKPPGAGITGA